MTISGTGAPQPFARRVALVGMMGSGKSRVGALLARALKAPFADSDAMVEKSVRLSIAAIFRRRGEAAFRRLERRAIARALAAPPPLVLALGGGAWCDGATRRLVRKRATAVWLKASPYMLARRLARRRARRRRPLLAGKPTVVVVRLAAKRAPLYGRADIVVEEAGLSPCALARRVRARLLYHAAHARS